MSLTFSDILPYVSGPVVGAVIGYFTNWIAVKMLFHPYTEKRLGPIRIPFTPGILPKRRGELAKAVGGAVSGSLLTSEDIRALLLNSETGDKLVDTAFTALGIGQADAPTVDALLLRLTDEEKIADGKDRIAAFLTEKLVAAARDMKLGTLIAERGGDVLREKKASLGLLGMMISDNMIDGLMQDLGGRVETFVDESGYTMALPVIRAQMDKLTARTADELLADADRDRLREIVRNVYTRAVSAFVGSIMQNFDIAGVVEDKINAMDIKELEDLCLSVMKKELNAIVNLGALIGFLLGIINIFTK